MPESLPVPAKLSYDWLSPFILSERTYKAETRTRVIFCTLCYETVKLNKVRAYIKYELETRTHFRYLPQLRVHYSYDAMELILSRYNSSLSMTMFLLTYKDQKRSFKSNFLYRIRVPHLDERRMSEKNANIYEGACSLQSRFIVLD